MGTWIIALICVPQDVPENAFSRALPNELRSCDSQNMPQRADMNQKQRSMIWTLISILSLKNTSKSAQNVSKNIKNIRKIRMRVDCIKGQKLHSISWYTRSSLSRKRHAHQFCLAVAWLWNLPRSHVILWQI